MVENCDTSLIKQRVYSVETFPYETFYRLPLIPKPPRKRKRYVNAIMTLDIETTKLDNYEQSIVYIWQICINNECVIGRDIRKLKVFLDKLCLYMDVQMFLMCFVHNLSFEFHHLREILNFEEVFSTAKRRPIKALYKQIEFRCSYILTNQSLDSFLTKMHVEALKTQMDYDKKRFPWSKINKKDTEYCLHDVIGLYQAIITLMKSENDTLYTIPLTSTGYTRRDIKKAYYKASRKEHFKESLPGFELLEELQEAFRGGNTHANRWITGKFLNAADYGLIHSWDRVSSYPDALLTHKFPWKFEHTELRIEECISLNKAVLSRAHITNLRIKDRFDGCPYIPISKCRNLSKDRVEDNGRILCANELYITITDIDYKIIKQQYYFDADFTDTYISDYEPLPNEIKKVILHYFYGKTNLKDIPDKVAEYNKFKNRFNAIYGLMVQNPAKLLIEYIADSEDIFQYDTSETIEEIYAKNKDKLFLLYQWGVWCTAIARMELQKMIDIVQSTQGALFLYCDTDSVKFIGNVDFTHYNSEQQHKAEKAGAVAKDIHGKIHYIGVLEQEQDMTQFITHGAKKYAYVGVEDHKLHLTCAGVNKKLGAEELNTIKWFKDGFIFGIAGGLEAKYNDTPKVRHVSINGKYLKIYSNIYLKDSTYTVSKAPKYKDLLDKLTYLEI